MVRGPLRVEENIIYGPESAVKGLIDQVTAW
jgi:hypothetical protein